jgi:DNA-binding CsgD family transcriptional regulator
VKTEDLLSEQLDRMGEIHRKSGLLADHEQEIRSALAAAKKIDWQPGIAQCTYLLARIHEWMRQMPEAEKLNGQAKKIAQQIGMTSLFVDCLAAEANIHLWNYRLAEAYKTAVEAYDLAVKEGNNYGVVLSNYVLGSVSQYYGADDESLKYYQNSLDSARKFGFLKLEGAVQDKLANLFLTRLQFGHAERFARAVAHIQHRLKNQRNFLRAQIQLASILIEAKKLEEAKNLLDEVILNENLLIDAEKGTLFLARGKLAQGFEKFAEAENLFTEAISIFSVLKRNQLTANAYLILCELHIQQQSIRKALHDATEALKLTEQGHDRYVEMQAYRLMYEVSKLSENATDALKYLELYHNNSAKQEAVVLHSQMQLIELETEYKMKQAEINEERRRAEELRVELGKKERELTTKTKHLIKRTESLAQFRDDLRAIIRRSPANDPLIQQVKERLNSTPESNLDWENFDKEFQSVHPVFTQKLEMKHPVLTKMEKKICEMLRLGLTSVDIAKLLTLSERNIENHRYRIRKKIALDTEKSLHEYLATI